MDPTYFKSLVGSLRYLTCTRPNIHYCVGLVSRYMEAPIINHMKAAKRILRYLKVRSIMDYFIIVLMSSSLLVIVIIIGPVTLMIKRVPLDIYSLWVIHHFHGV